MHPNFRKSMSICTTMDLVRLWNIYQWSNRFGNDNGESAVLKELLEARGVQPVSGKRLEVAA